MGGFPFSEEVFFACIEENDCDFPRAEGCSWGVVSGVDEILERARMVATEAVIATEWDWKLLSKTRTAYTI